MSIEEIFAKGNWVVFGLGFLALHAIWVVVTSAIRAMTESWLKRKNGNSSAMRVTNSRLDTDVEKLLTQGARTNQLLEAQLDLTRAIKENQVRLSGQIETLVTLMTQRGVS